MQNSRPKTPLLRLSYFTQFCFKINTHTIPFKSFSSTLPHPPHFLGAVRTVWCSCCHIIHAAARRLWQFFCIDLPQLHQKIAIRRMLRVPLETILVRSKEAADTHPQLCSLLEPSNNHLKCCILHSSEAEI